MRCLLMTVSIKNLVEYGNTSAATRLITINTKPSASSQRRGRISFQTSGKTARSLWTFGVFWAVLRSVVNLLLDSARPGLASLLLHCDMPGPAVVSSGRATSAVAGALSNPGPVARPDRDARGGRSL